MGQDKRLKIGFFMDDYYPSINGVNLVMDNCARSFGKYGEIVLCVPYIDKKYIDDFPYKVIRVKGLGPKLFEHTWALPTIDFDAKRELCDEHFDIIHLHSPFIMGRFAVNFARKINVPVVGTIHTRFDYELDRLHLKGICKKIPMDWIIRTFNLCDECFTVNEPIKEIYEELGVSNKISIVPNATDMVTSETIDEDKAYINKKYNLDENENILLFVGRISIVKNIQFILDSLKILCDKGIHFKMLFVGPIEDGKVFYQKIEELQLNEHIIICDAIYDRNLLKKIYVRADLLLLPTHYDTSSLVQKEAASQFTPTVFLENAPTAFNVVNDYNGFLTPFDKESYANKIIEVLNNRSLLQEVSRNCHDTLYKTWDDVCKILFEHYTRLLCNKNDMKVNTR